ncbi:MAG: DUF4065 domain-containing protein [Abditibacteriota bacterium]|nr:DUF4065 domain-containing protein [Abditibacteriota bacterium]MBP5094147.1 DUF4065 domain-containing protein [Abditibacteriota bacterium]
MTRKTTFCETCRDDVKFTVKTLSKTGNLRGKDYTYTGKEARCNECGSLVFVPDIVDFNLDALYDVYREKNGILPTEVIAAVPKKYKIGKRPLSLLLGWGEQTYTRYCEGHVPSKAYSDIIKHINDDPRFYMSLLEKNKEAITPEAYRKSRKAVEALLSGAGKIDKAAEYLMYRCGDITPFTLQKYLYYVQGFGYAFNGDFLFAEDCEAWVYGPVYKNIYAKYKSRSFHPADKPTDFDMSALTDDEKTVCDSVIDNLCCYSGEILVRFTHNESPWLETRKGLAPDAQSNRIITKESIAAYFDAVKSKYNMINPVDIKEYAEAMFDRVR